MIVNSTKLHTAVSIKDTVAISVLNSLWHIVAGQQFSLDDPLILKLYNAGKAGMMEPEMHGPVSFLPWLSNLAPKLTGLTVIHKAFATLHTIFDDIISTHQQSSLPTESSRNFIDVYLQKIKETTDPHSSFYKQEGINHLRDTLIALFIAGSDTLSNTLGFAFLYLTTHKNVMKKVQCEIDAVIGRSRAPDSTDRHKMPYTEAVILEVLRLSSIIAANILHSTSEDVEFMGYFLPKGTIIMPNLYQIHHDEEYWGDPENFRPERFLRPDGSFRKDEKVIPFSVGKRVCIAENLAQIEFFLFLTGILQSFEVNEDPNHPLPSFEAKTASVLSPQPYNIVLSER